MNTQQLHDLARMGAQSRLAALDQERDAILKMFPDLRNGRPAARKAEAAPKGGKGHLSPEARQRQAERMRAYWAERKAQKAGVDGGTAKGTERKSSGKAAKSAKPNGGGMSAEARKAQAERMKAYWAAKRAAKQAAGQAEATGATNGGSSSKKQGRKSDRKAERKQGRKS
jgi:hypothetical protein